MCVKNTGYSFIEFEISNGTVLFQQNSSERKERKNNNKVNKARRMYKDVMKSKYEEIATNQDTIFEISVYIYIYTHTHVYIYIYIYTHILCIYIYICTNRTPAHLHRGGLQFRQESYTYIHTYISYHIISYHIISIYVYIHIAAFMYFICIEILIQILFVHMIFI